jgi:hypothetical protein
MIVSETGTISETGTVMAWHKQRSRATIGDCGNAVSKCVLSHLIPRLYTAVNIPPNY